MAYQKDIMHDAYMLGAIACIQFQTRNTPPVYVVEQSFDCTHKSYEAKQTFWTFPDTPMRLSHLLFPYHF